MPELLDDASLPGDAAGLREQLQILEERLEACENNIRQLMAEEDPDFGRDHAASIHQAKQLKMMLHYQKHLRRARLNQLFAN